MSQATGGIPSPTVPTAGPVAYRVASASGPDRAWGGNDDIQLPRDGSPSVVFARRLPATLVVGAVLAYLTLTAVWVLSGRGLRIATVLAFPIALAAFMGGVIVDGAKALGAPPITTPLGGRFTPHLSVYAATLVAAVALMLVRVRRLRVAEEDGRLT